MNCIKDKRVTPCVEPSGYQTDKNGRRQFYERNETFICIPAVHIISFCVSFLSRVDELNKLAGSQCMGLHSSGW